MAATLVTSMLALLVTTAPAVSAASSEPKPIRCIVDVAYNDWGGGDWYWTGPIYGCSISGTIKMWELPPFFAGSTEHYFEEFLITTNTGTISGTDAGVWNFGTFKFRSNGWVTAGTGDLEYLVGYKVHQMGVTSPWPGELPITADGAEMTFVAP